MSATLLDRIVLNRLQVSRISLLVLVYGVVISAPSLLFAFGSVWLAYHFPSVWWLIPISFFILLAMLAPIVYFAILYRIESQMLRDQQRYHRTLITASRGMIQVKEIDRLCGLITHVVNRTVGLENTLVFLHDTKEQRFKMRAARYPSQIPTDLAIEQADSLVELLEGGKDLIVVDELKEDQQTKHEGRRAKNVENVYNWMRQHEAQLIVPSFSNDKLLAFLVLGAKRPLRPFSKDDLAIFSGLANQAALALENSLFFEELRSNEAFMVQSEKLASLGQLASGMAHEIHNPLTIISGESQLHLERFRGQDPKVDALLNSIIEECKRASDITRRILRFAKPAPTDLSPVDLKSTVEESLALAGYQTRLDRVERTVDIPENLPKVRSNQNQLQEVLLNLILNACQAMGERGGKLTLTVRPHGPELILRVEDNGPGIPPSTIRKVFDPFFTTKATGTGLGLFVTQRIVRSHGGRIDLESTEGKGTCFTIALPVWKEELKVEAFQEGNGQRIVL